MEKTAGGDRTRDDRGKGMSANMPQEADLELRRARYADLMRFMEWRVFAHGCKERCGFRCQHCPESVGCRKPGELEVHHWWYDLNRWPWEYAERDVVVLCAECHGALHEQLEVWKEFARARWEDTPEMFGNFVYWVRRFVFPGLTADSFAGLNGRLMVGGEVKASGVAGQALSVLAKVGGARREVES